MADQGFTYDQAQGLRANAYTRTSYEFLGWSTDASATSPSYSDGQSVSNFTTTNGGVVTLYAVWKLSTTSITFHDNGGNGGPGTVTWLIGSTQTPDTPSREGYSFAGWNSSEAGTGTDWPSDNTVPAGIPDYYAQWAPVTYQVTFDPNGGVSENVIQEESLLKTGAEINRIFQDLSGDLSRIRLIRTAPARPVSGYTAISTSGKEVDVWYDGGTVFVYTEATRVRMNQDSSGLLKDMASLKDIGPVGTWDFEGVTNANEFFYGDSSMTALNLTVWNTSRMEKAARMFYGCSSLRTILADSSNWNIEAVGNYEDGSEVFTGCTSLVGGDGTSYQAGSDEILFATTSGGYLTQSTPLFRWENTMQRFHYGETKSLAVNQCARTGYTFLGWSDTPEGTVLYTDGQEVSNLSNTADSVVTLYAVWKQNAYSVLFDRNDEKAEGTMPAQVFLYDEAQNLSLNAFTKLGYHFDQWNLAADRSGTGYTDGQEVMNLSSADKSTVSLYAFWIPNDYTVRFNKNSEWADGGMLDQGFTYDTAQNLSANGFRRTGYTFGTWNTEEDGNGNTYQDQEEVLNLTPERDGIVDLYVQWNPNHYKVHFDPNGAEGTMEDMELVYDEERMLELNKFTRSGYEFKEWNTRSDGSGISYQEGTKVMNLTADRDGSVTLYAVWVPCAYIIQYSGNGATSGEMGNQFMNYDVAVNLLENQFTRTGYTFAGWKCMIGSTSRTFADKELVLNLTDEKGKVLTMQAQWEATGYRVVYDRNADDATGTMQSQTMAYDRTGTLSENGYVRPGYTFDSWNTQSNGLGTRYEAKAEVKNLASQNGASVTLYAQWTPVTYQISFDGNGGTGVMDPVTATYDGETVLPAGTFRKAGYPFSGWNTKADGTGTSYSDQSTVMNLTSKADETVTLYAQWQPSAYYIRFHGGAGVKGTMPDQPAAYDVRQTLTLNRYTKPGYTFTGWNTMENGKGTAYADGAEIYNLTKQDGAVISLYAQWESNAYTVKFHANTEDVTGAMEDQTLHCGTEEELSMCGYRKTGATFAGWNTSPDGTGISYRDKETVLDLTTVKDGTIDLYAQWQENSYTIDFKKNAEDVSGMMLAQPFTYGKSQPLNQNTYARNGYHFAGWNTKPDGSGQSYQDMETVKNLTSTAYAIVELYAQWEGNSYYVTFVSNSEYASGSMAAQKFSYGTAQKLNTCAYANDGTLFNGWNTEADGSGTAYEDGQVLSTERKEDGATVTLYAQWLANAYYVAFDGNGATSGIMAKQALVENRSMQLNPNRYEKTGYHFKGWATNPDGTGTVCRDQAYVNNLKAADGTMATLYAQWEANTYTISYNRNSMEAEGTAEDIQVTCGQPVTVRQNPFTRTGYVFAGWNTAADGNGTLYTEGQTVQDLTTEQNGTVTLYAQWSPIHYWIRYHKNNESAYGSVANTKVSYAETAIISRCGYILDGYTFKSWNTRADGTGESYPAGTEISRLSAVNGDVVTLYAQWTANTYTIGFRKNAEKAAGAMETMTLAYDETKTLTLNTYTNTGYTFTGWNTRSDGTGTAYTDGQEVRNLTQADNGEILLYAQWLANTYRVSFDANGAEGAMSDQTFHYDTEEALTTSQYTKEGYMFVGWNTEADGSGTAYTDGQPVKNLTAEPNGTVTLYAQWGTIRYYIDFDGNGATSGSMERMTLSYDTTRKLNPNAYVRAGYTFGSWNTRPDGSGAGYQNNGEVTNLTDTAESVITLYAQWTPNRYTVKFDKNAEDAEGAMADQAMAYGEEMNLDQNRYTRPGYTFDGWALRADGKGTKYTDGQKVSSLTMTDHGEVTLYAQWRPVQYRIHFDAGAFNAKGTMADQTMTYGTEALLTANGFSRSGYSFDGWNTESNGTGTSYQDKQNVLNLTDREGTVITLYAQWGHSRYYVEFNRNGGTDGTMERQEFVSGEAKELTANTFSRTGYRFTGWNTAADGTGTGYADGATLTDAASTAGAVITLYAQWESSDCTVTYQLNGGSWKAGYTPTTDYKYDDEIVLPTAAQISKEGCIFLGWYDNAALSGSSITKLPAYTGNKTLYAGWYDYSGKKSGVSKPIRNSWEYGE